MERNDSIVRGSTRFSPRIKGNSTPVERSWLHSGWSSAVENKEGAVSRPGCNSQRRGLKPKTTITLGREKKGMERVCLEEVRKRKTP